MSEKLEKYSDVIAQLVQETVACAPETWTHGALFIQSDGVRLTYQLKSGANEERATISELLRDLIEELYVQMREHREAWTGAQVVWTRCKDDVKFDLSFEYLQQ